MTEVKVSDLAGAPGLECDTLPDFFILGAPKCGTTTLYDWLLTHEQVYMPGKELCYFSQDIFPTGHLIGHIPDMAAYRTLFSVPAAMGKTKGDATPKYLHSEQALNEIRQLGRRPRLIVCLRDPVDLAISLHTQKVGEGWEREIDFAKAWARELNETTAEAARTRPSETNYIFWAHLGARLDRLFSMFERVDVQVVHLRELRDTPRAVYQRLLAFLDLTDDSRELLNSSNSRIGFVSPTLNRWARRVTLASNPVLGPLRRLRGGRGFGILKLFNRLNVVENSYVGKVSDQLRDEMYTFLASDITLAESLIDGSLTERRLGH